MSKIDKSVYSEIKERFRVFIECFENGSSEGLSQCILKEAACYMNIEPAYAEGGRHGLSGISSFIDNLPKPDACSLNVYNFVAHCNSDTVRQSAIVVGRCYKEDEEYKYCEFNAYFTNEWICTEDGWRISVLRMDIVDVTGNYKEYYSQWYFEENKLKWHAGVHMAVISPELDNPWEFEAIDLSDEEKIYDAFCQYAYAVDCNCFSLMPDVYDDECVVNMAPFGVMDKRSFLKTLKLHRQSNYYWYHPVKIKSLKIEKDNAYLELYRLNGHRQRYDSVLPEKEQFLRERACARYEIKLKKKNGSWKISKLDYFLGIIEL